MSCKSSIFLHGVMGTNWGLACQLSNVTGTHWKCFVNCLFISILSRVLIGVSVCLHDVTATHCECLVNRLFVSMMSQLLIVSVLSIVYLCP